MKKIRQIECIFQNKPKRDVLDFLSPKKKDERKTNIESLRKPVTDQPVQFYDLKTKNKPVHPNKE